jgi:hypothetical protein
LTKEERYFGALGAGPRPKLNVSWLLTPLTPPLNKGEILVRKVVIKRSVKKIL